MPALGSMQGQRSPLTSPLLLQNIVWLPVAHRTEAEFPSLVFKILPETVDVNLCSCNLPLVSPTLIDFLFSQARHTFPHPGPFHLAQLCTYVFVFSSS